MSFIDPREKPRFGGRGPQRTTADPSALAELHRLCKEGALYDVERWIQDGRPLQVSEAVHRRPTSALEIALKVGNKALAQLLLFNGYDPNLERYCPLDLALESRRFDLVDLLLDCGADPQQVDLGTLFATYRTDLFVRFQELGVELTADHAVAEALAYHTSNRPLFGFAKRHRETNSKFQTELNIALVHHAGEGNEKGVQLCLWAGADPHTPAPSLRYQTGSEEDEGTSAVFEACMRGQAEILRRLRPDPARDDFNSLFQMARSGAVVELLAQFALPTDVGGVVQHHVWWLGSFQQSQSLDALRRLFQVGARWTHSPPQEIALVRRGLLKVSDKDFGDAIRIMARDDHCSPTILQELGRTPAMRDRLKKVGFLPPSANDPNRFGHFRPPGSKEVLRKLGIELPKPTQTRAPRQGDPRPPRLVRIGPRRPRGQEVRLDRAGLLDRVWSEPVATLAVRWGVSGQGLRKACLRLRIPVPPRGYWARLRAGQRTPRPPLPKLPGGEPEAIAVWALQEGTPAD